MHEVFDINFGDTLHTFKDPIKAAECAREMNEGHLDKMYGVRELREVYMNGGYCLVPARNAH